LINVHTAFGRIDFFKSPFKIGKMVVVINSLVNATINRYVVLDVFTLFYVYKCIMVF
jgi:hypothetical protein